MGSTNSEILSSVGVVPEVSSSARPLEIPLRVSDRLCDEKVCESVPNDVFGELRWYATQYMSVHQMYWNVFGLR